MRNPHLARNGDGGDLRFAEMFGKRHGGIVRSSHSERKVFCAFNAKVATQDVCNHRRMIRKHPTRPHLRAWRLRAGKTLEWVANEIGTSHTTVSRQEGGTGVDDATFAAIACAYGITVAELSAPPDQAEKARALDCLLRTVRDMDAASIEVLAGLAARLKPAG